MIDFILIFPINLPNTPNSMCSIYPQMEPFLFTKSPKSKSHSLRLCDRNKMEVYTKGLYVVSGVEDLIIDFPIIYIQAWVVAVGKNDQGQVVRGIFDITGSVSTPPAKMID